MVAQFFQLIIDFTKENFIGIFLAIFILAIIIWAIVKKDLFLEKIKNEQVSFIALIFGIVLASANLLMKPKPLSVTGLTTTGDVAVIASISVGVIIAFILIGATIWFISPKGD